MTAAPSMGRRWSPEDIAELRALWEGGLYDNAALAERFGRTEKGIIRIRHRLRLTLPPDVYLSRLNCSFTANELKVKRAASIAETDQWERYVARATARLGEAIERMLGRQAA